MNPAIDFVTQSLAGIETESFLIEGLNIRSDTTVIEIPFHPEPRAAGTGGGARPSLVSLLGEEPLQAEVIGYSGSEIEIGMLLGRLTASPYTDGARLTKTGRTRIDSQTMHEFRIAFALRRQGAAERTATADKSGGDGDLSQP